MIYEICTQTDVGRMRDNNEDAVAFELATKLCILADGMGGYNAGEIASAMAVSIVHSELGRWLALAGPHTSAKEVRHAMQACVESANLSILNAASANPPYAGMGTTLVTGVFQDHTLIIGHIGDSRCYRLRDGQLVQITKDHSRLQEQIDAGIVTPEQAQTALNRNLLTRALGVEHAMLLEVNEHPVDAGDTYLMCSDGLSDMLNDEDIAVILRGAGPLQLKASQLVAAANAAGGRDNISVLLAQAKAAPRKRSLLARVLGA